MSHHNQNDKYPTINRESEGRRVAIAEWHLCYFDILQGMDNRRS